MMTLSPIGHRLSISGWNRAWADASRRATAYAVAVAASTQVDARW